MFLGTQFRTIDPRRLTIIELAEKAANPSSPENHDQGGQTPNQ